MGYSNQRRRCKRKRTRTLNAIQNVRSLHHNACSSDESSVDVLPQNSSSASFRSNQSPHSFMASEDCTIPSNIFLDDVNMGRTRVSPNYDIQVEDSEEEPISIVDFEFMDDLSNYDRDSTTTHQEEEDATLDSIASTSDKNNTDRDQHYSHFSQEQPHRFTEMTINETASYKIMSLLDTMGAPRICYDRLVALLKKLCKNGFDAQKGINRETLMQRLTRRYKARPRIQMGTINKQEVFRFMFNDMLQDLLHSSSMYLHTITPTADWENPKKGTEHELWNTQWMRNTFRTTEYSDFDPDNDIMLPVILYMDKTGTDVNQRYSLEPVLFSLAALPREQRESRHSWRHLGFVPQKLGKDDDEQSSSSLQFYHDCLSYLLDGLRQAQKEPPTVSIKLPPGNIVQRRALLPLMIVMGDQLSQDTLCGRLKSNSGGAGRVHRGCMCSYLNIDDPYNECKKVDMTTLHLLTTYATTAEMDMDSKISFNPTCSANTKDIRISKSFLLRQRTMFRSILRHPFTMHPIKNAFSDINFGSWTAGIHDATCDDFMHSVEAGMIAYITETVYDGLTKKEKETVEEITRSMLDDQRCSIMSTYPRWRLQPGFSRQTLMTSGERVGSVLALSLSLQNPIVRETIRVGHARQIQKYLDLSPEPSALNKNLVTDQSAGDTTMKSFSPTSPPEFYLDPHMHRLDDESIRHTMEHMLRHGFPISIFDDLDPFQLNQMIWQCAEIFKTSQYPDHYPPGDIVDSYTDLGQNFVIPKDQFRLVKYALQTQPCKLLSNHRRRKVEGATGKHFKKKANKKGEGSSSAVLCTNMATLNIFLEYVLCYHAFCKYSWTLPVFLQRNFDNIKAGNQFVVEYFQKLLYRGNASVDSRFPKIHAQCRMGRNTEALNTLMNFCCETGERLLKTEAKGISKTAQQRGNATFLTQTMSRLQDRSILDCFARYLDELENKSTSIDPNQTDRFSRTHPHFICNIDEGQILSVDKNNRQTEPNCRSGFISREVIEALKKHEPGMRRFEIYNEVTLRDNSRVRASPNYANSGPWYDYANITWENSVGSVVETYLLPAKCLCFFRKNCQEIMALVHTVDNHSVGKIPDRTDTLLTRHYRLQYDHKGTPVTHVVPVASIDSAIRCFPHVPSNTLFDTESTGITYVLPRNHWAYIWMALNDALVDSNSKDKVKRRKGKLVSLCSIHWLDSVRQRYKKYLQATSIEDL